MKFKIMVWLQWFSEPVTTFASIAEPPSGLDDCSRPVKPANDPSSRDH